MALEITGKLTQLLPLQSGTSARGEWKKQDFILETEEQYPKKVCISLWGDKLADIEGIQMGETITASVNIESREFNGRWYTDVRAWRIQRAQVSVNTGAIPPAAPPITPPDDNNFTDSGGDSFDDLPF